MNPLIKELPKYIKYDPTSGTLSLKGDLRFSNTSEGARRIFPDDDRNIITWIPPLRKIIKCKMKKICYYLGTGRFPTNDERMLHKNLDEDDYRLSNLAIVPKEKFRGIKEAIMNLNGHLKIVRHSTDQYQYTVHFRKGRRNSKIVCEDIIHAQRVEREMRLEFIKLITTYCNTEI